MTLDLIMRRHNIQSCIIFTRDPFLLMYVYLAGFYIVVAAEKYSKCIYRLLNENLSCLCKAFLLGLIKKLTQ